MYFWLFFHRFLFVFVYWNQYVFNVYLNYFEDNKCITFLLSYIILMQTENATSKYFLNFSEGRNKERKKQREKEIHSEGRIEGKQRGR